MSVMMPTRMAEIEAILNELNIHPQKSSARMVS